MDIRRANVSDTKQLHKLQSEAYRLSAGFNPTGGTDTVEQVRARLESHDWIVYIGLTEGQIDTSVSYLLLENRWVYACRWVSARPSMSSFRLFWRTYPLLQKVGIARIIARIYNDPKWIRVYTRYFKSATPQETVECSISLAGHFAQSPDRVYMIKELEMIQELDAKISSL
jgi:hypothetical protein